MYTLEVKNMTDAELKILRTSAHDAFMNIPCTTECRECPNKRVCRALNRLTAYAESEIVKRARNLPC